MTKRRLIICSFALMGALVGGVLGVMVAPGGTRYKISTNVALVPPPNLSTSESSGLWEVLTGGQINRNAAIVYSDPRWLPSAANAADIRAAFTMLGDGCRMSFGVPVEPPDGSMLMCSETRSGRAASDRVVVAAIHDRSTIPATCNVFFDVPRPLRSTF